MKSRKLVVVVEVEVIICWWSSLGVCGFLSFVFGYKKGGYGTLNHHTL